MKKIEATIQPFQVDQVKAALDRLGVPGLTVGEVHALDDRKGDESPIGGLDTLCGSLPHIKIELLVDDAAVADTVASIALALGNGGAVEALPLFVAPVEDVVRIRTGERGAAAV